MDLWKTQAVLARIYTDAAFRQRFFGDPLAVGEEMASFRKMRSGWPGFARGRSTFLPGHWVALQATRPAASFRFVNPVRFLGRQMAKDIRQKGET